MKKVLSLMALLLFGFTLTTHAQVSKKERAERREALKKERAERRALEAQQDSIAYLKALEAIKAGSFVLEADYVGFPSGLTRYVSQSTNYFEVNEGKGILQTSFANFTYQSGPNGLGGVTVSGNVATPKIREDKDGHVFATYNIQGIAVSATVMLTLTGGTNQASITISPNFNNNSMTMTGHLLPYDESTVFQGTTW